MVMDVEDFSPALDQFYNTALSCHSSVFIWQKQAQKKCLKDAE